MSGFALNWFVVARPLRRLSLETNTVTLTELLAHDAPKKIGRAISVSASIVILLSLGVYVASQFQAAGKTFAGTLDMDFAKAVWIGGGIVLIYTMSGGFWAASVSDLIQGIVMAVAAAVVPIGALIHVGGFGDMFAGLQALDPKYVDWYRGNHGWTLAAFIVGTLGIGLGYPGQPHVVNRYMALRSDDDVRRGTWITMGWGLIIYSGMLIAGWCGRVMAAELADGETILLKLTTDLFPPVVAGVIVAAVLSAIMSTADSQLLVCGSTVAHDLPRRGSHRKVGLDRAAIVGISIVAILAALNVDETIFNTVLFAWSALGAAFGPLLLVRLLRGTVRPWAALASIWVGFAVTLIWYFTPELKGALYELVPAFAAAMIPAWLGSSRRG